MTDALRRHIIDWNRLGWAFVLRLESFANLIADFMLFGDSSTHVFVLVLMTYFQ